MKRLFSTLIKCLWVLIPCAVLSQTATLIITNSPQITYSNAPTSIPPGTSITDSVGATWTVSGGVISRNGVATISGQVVYLLYFNGVIYQENANCNWWDWNNGTSAWVATTQPAAPNIPACPATGSSSSSSGGGSASTVSVPFVSSLYGIVATGTAPASGGIDGAGDAYAKALLGSSLTWNGAAFTFGPAGVANAITSATIALPAGKYATLDLLGSGVNGNQVNQTIVVTYTDGTTSTFVQSFSDWCTGTAYAGQSVALATAYRITPTGATLTGSCSLYGYAFALNPAKTVQSVTLPANSNVVVLAVDLTTIAQSGSTASTGSVNLASAANVPGIGIDGAYVLNTGLDGGYSVYSGTLLGTTLAWSGSTFTFGAAGTLNAVSSETITLPAGNYTAMSLLGTAVNGNQTNQTFTVTYSDATTATFTQSLSDWGAPQSYAGESIASTMAYRLSGGGTQSAGPYYLYGYSFTLNSAKTVASITLPTNANVAVLAIDLTSAAGSSSSSSSSSSGGGSSSSGSSSSSGGSSSSGSSSSSGGSAVPAPAAAVGYNTQTFGPAVTLNSNWFPANLEGCNTSPQAYSQNANGSVYLSGYGNTCSGANIATAIQNGASANGWTGLAFGGGAYFEATMSFTGQGNGPYANGGPAFWAEDIEHMSQGPYVVGWPSTANAWNSGTTYAQNATVSYNNQVWISNVANNVGNTPPSGTSHGNAAWELYNNFYEVDFMEYDCNQYAYQNGIGNWWGNNSHGGPGGGTSNPVTSGTGCAGGVVVPNTTVFSQFHKYGTLWVPATGSGQTTMTQGYLKFYFDGVQTGQTFYWNYHDINSPATYPAPPPINGDTAMSGMDFRHLFLMLGTGTNQPVTVQSVSVWQASAANNITH